MLYLKKENAKNGIISILARMSGLVSSFLHCATFYPAAVLWCPVLASGHLPCSSGPHDQVLPLCPAVKMPWCVNAGCCVPFIMSPSQLCHQHYITIPITADCTGQDREHLSCPPPAQSSLNTGTHCIALQSAQQGESKQARTNKWKKDFKPHYVPDPFWLSNLWLVLVNRSQ